MPFSVIARCLSTLRKRGDFGALRTPVPEANNGIRLGRIEEDARVISPEHWGLPALHDVFGPRTELAGSSETTCPVTSAGRFSNPARPRSRHESRHQADGRRRVIAVH
jgi:hypothetical protein